jgi:beta-aspartyl-dipeptidase (metallo-type)
VFPRSDADTEPLTLLGGDVLTPAGLIRSDVRTLGPTVVSIGRDGPEHAEPSLEEQTIDCSGCLVMPAIVDGHCHPLGGGGGAGPQAQNLPLLLEEYLTAGVGAVIGVLGHDTVTRSPESLLVRLRALRLMGLPAYGLGGEIAYPPTALTGSISRDLALIETYMGVKTSLGEPVSPADSSELLTLYAEIAKGSRTAGKSPQLHLHLGEDPTALQTLDKALDSGRLPAGHVTVTHANWNPSVLERCTELMLRGVHVDVTACIRPDYFPGSVDPREALDSLLSHDPSAARVSISSDAGGSHTHGPAVVRHTPHLLLEVLRDMVTAERHPVGVLARVFGGSTIARHGLDLPVDLRPGGPATALILPQDPTQPITFVLGGRVVVRDGHALYADPVAPTR